jgi:phenylalanyl-tRNA synthetase beta chain
VVNPVAAQHTYLRTSLRASLLQAYAHNRRHDDGLLQLFEIGFEYLPVEAELPVERTVFCALAGGHWPNRSGLAGPERLDFFDAKSIAAQILDGLGIGAEYAPSEQHGLLAGHTARVTADGHDLGIVGQVHPTLADEFDVEEPVFLVEFSIADLAAAAPARPNYSPPGRFPDVRQDLALLVDAATPAGHVLGLVHSHRTGDVSIEARVFDDYRGEGIPPGLKSLALALSFRAAGRTLTDADVARVQQGLLKRLERELGARVRGA